jgi:hypothetical protein
VDGARARFSGAGDTPAEQRSSLLHALLPTLDIHTTDFPLAPSSWPTCSYLTSLQLGNGCHYSTNADCLHAALQATSLVALEVAAADDDRLALLAGISNLTRLASLSIVSRHTESLDGEAGAQVVASIALLSKLQQLTIRCINQEPQLALGPGGPACWAHLTRLTSLSLTSRCVDLRQLAPLQQLQRLDVQGSPVCVGSLTSLFALTRLTALRSGKSRWTPTTYTSEPDGSALQEEEEVVVPAAWREGLRVLHWGCGDSATTPALLSQLTSLVELHAHGLVVTPEACRCVRIWLVLTGWS